MSSWIELLLHDLAYLLKIVALFAIDQASTRTILSSNVASNDHFVFFQDQVAHE